MITPQQSASGPEPQGPPAHPPPAPPVSSNRPLQSAERPELPLSEEDDVQLRREFLAWRKGSEDYGYIF